MANLDDSSLSIINKIIIIIFKIIFFFFQINELTPIKDSNYKDIKNLETELQTTKISFQDEKSSDSLNVNSKLIFLVKIKLHL